MVEKLFDAKEVEGDGDKNKEPQLPDEYKGKSPEELVKLIQQEKQAKTEVQGRFNKLSDRLINSDEPPAKREEPAVPPEKTDFFTEPEKAANELFDRKMAPMASAFLTDKESAHMTYVMSMPNAEEFADEIKAIFDGATPQAKVSPSFGQEVYRYIRGKHYDEFQKADSTRKSKEPEFHESTSSGGGGRKETPTLSPMEQEAAEGLGLTADKYIRWRDSPDEARKDKRSKS